MADRARVLLLTGTPGVGKSTVAALLVSALVRGAHVEADVLHRFIRTGGQWPSRGTDEAMRQLLLRTRNAAMLTASFADAGFTAILDEVIATDAHVRNSAHAAPAPPRAR